MIVVHRFASRDGRCERHLLQPGESIPPDAVWIDLFEPTREEDHEVERHLGIEVPSREDVDDIEPSEILYSARGARYMSARILFGSETARPYIGNVTFILTKTALVTVRYDESQSFARFAQRLGRPQACGGSPSAVLAGLVEAISDRAAETLQRVGERVDDLSRAIFDPGATRQNERHRGTIAALGRAGDLVSQVRESLVSVERMLLFIEGNGSDAHQGGAELQAQARTTLRDKEALEEHATFISGKIQFLLDAVLGLVNLEQNNIIKLFTVVGVVLMPPTLIASIYGMNFKNIPELQFDYGYPMALGVMLLSAILPYSFFKWKGWF